MPIDDLPLDSTKLADLSAHLQELTDIPVELQKLVYKGKKATADPQSTLEQAGIQSGVKIMLLGTPSAELGKFKKEEADAEYRATVMARRQAAAPTKVMESCIRLL